MENEKNVTKELSYIKSVLKQSQFSFEHGTRFFLVIAVYMFVANMLQVVGDTVFRINLNIDNYKAIVNSKLLSVGGLILLLIPLAFIIWHFYRLEKHSSSNMSLWLFGICAFTIVSCLVVPPLICLPNISDNVIPDIFNITGISICMFVCGQLLQSKKIKRMAVVYYSIIFVIILVLEFWFVTIAAKETVLTSGEVKMLHSYAYAISGINVIYAPVGYLLLGLCIRKENNRLRDENNEV